MTNFIQFQKDFNNDAEVSVKLNEHFFKMEYTFSPMCFKKLNGQVKEKKVDLA